ncbi:MAG TPA: YaaL family protein [Clostridiaceae bacterium]|nr:YaaL family protein [Clostridiaceae bacterium]
MRLNYTNKNFFKAIFDWLLRLLNNLFCLFNKNKLQQVLSGKGLDYIGSKNEYSEEEMLIQDLKEAKNEWLNADLNFQYVVENEFIEYYTYRLKAAQIKYEYFLKKAKEKGIRVNIFENDIAAKNDHISINFNSKGASFQKGTSATVLKSNVSRIASTGSGIPVNIEK